MAYKIVLKFERSNNKKLYSNKSAVIYSKSAADLQETLVALCQRYNLDNHSVWLMNGDVNIRLGNTIWNYRGTASRLTEKNVYVHELTEGDLFSTAPDKPIYTVTQARLDGVWYAEDSDIHNGVNFLSVGNIVTLFNYSI